MSEITLADYTGFLLQEIVKARRMADEYSREVARVYAQDPLLQHFPTPRFKLPKVELTIPVLVSSARLSQMARFAMKPEVFMAGLRERVDEVVRTVRSRGGNNPPRVARSARSRAAPRPSASIDAQARAFHEALSANPDPMQAQGIVARNWEAIFEQSLRDTGLTELHRRTDPSNELLKATTKQMHEFVQAATVIDRTKIDSLLVQPETLAVKAGSSDRTVFTIKADLLEETVQIRSARDEATGETSYVVDFD